MTTVYRVRDWSAHEVNRTRDVRVMRWVPLPTDLADEAYVELIDHEDGAAHWGVWCALLIVAARSPARGVLMREGGRPHDLASLARQTRISAATIGTALPRLIAVGLIDASEAPAESEPAAQVRQDCDADAPTPQARRRRAAPAPHPDPPSPLSPPRTPPIHPSPERREEEKREEGNRIDTAGAPQATATEVREPRTRAASAPQADRTLPTTRDAVDGSDRFRWQAAIVAALLPAIPENWHRSRTRIVESAIAAMGRRQADGEEPEFALREIARRIGEYYASPQGRGGYSRAPWRWMDEDGWLEPAAAWAERDERQSPSGRKGVSNGVHPERRSGRYAD